MDYTGSVFVNENTNTGQYIGLVFAYQNNKRFYLVAWRNSHRNDEEDRHQTGLKGLQIKVNIWFSPHLLHFPSVPRSDIVSAGSTASSSLTWNIFVRLLHTSLLKRLNLKPATTEKRFQQNPIYIQAAIKETDYLVWNFSTFFKKIIANQNTFSWLLEFRK